jgi:SAM-dependent methyltransferase
MKYSSDAGLEKSAVVANCRMNRERNLSGSNGYAVEIGFEPLERLFEIAERTGKASWLDLCCGSGKALIEAAELAANRNATIEITGVDLVGMFLPNPYSDQCELIEASLSTWIPDRRFDLITCIHGLHYIGDKLKLIENAASWLCNDGLFVANLDLANVVVDGFTDRVLTSSFNSAGIDYDRRRHLLTAKAKLPSPLPFRYLESDDEAGPNYTGQAAVNSHYRRELKEA